MSRIQAYIYLLVVIAVIVGLLGLSFYLAQKPSDIPGSETEDNTPIPQPAYTEAVQAQLAASNGFQALVSYTNGGFEPAKLSIDKGDTIRFTNNTHKDLWVAAGGGPLYPSLPDSCGSSALDSCHMLRPGEFWEFMFDVAGSWSYLNSVDKTKQGVVNVQ